MEVLLFLTILTWGALVADVLPVIGAPAALGFAVLCASLVVVLGGLSRPSRVRGASAVVLVSLAAWVGPLRYCTVEGAVVFLDGGEHGTTGLVVYRKRDLAPRLVIFLEDDRERSQRRSSSSFPRGVSWSTTWSSSPPDGWLHTDVDVDVGRGLVRVLGREHSIPVGATVVHVQRRSVVASAAPLGSASSSMREVMDSAPYVGLSDVPRCFAGPVDPTLQGALTGRTSTRCFDIYSCDGERFSAKVHRGRVLSVRVAPLGTRACFRCLPCVVAKSSPGRLVRISSDRTETQAELPTFAQLHQALAAIEGGASIADATATWPQPR